MRSCENFVFAVENLKKFSIFKHQKPLVFESRPKKSLKNPQKPIGFWELEKAIKIFDFDAVNTPCLHALLFLKFPEFLGM
ncbi:hypothetical protein A9507_15410 [Methanobacterium sp. A39]|uniref:Uncharacterized protein n=1 Tax=Methanobacterium bryantii TaxID=2161 RepID=A0A2A2H4T1_METBR|nr:hypothetical protein A9507_15410 [Methanobacterium sp. A39]PAV04398.1 hypothetical protein ASJ80_06020 [Methanobacterium bryantii]